MKWIFSLGLDWYIRMSISMYVLCCIDKVGGLDEYLLIIFEYKLDNDLVWEWRIKIVVVYYKFYNLEVFILIVKFGMDD